MVLRMRANVVEFFVVEVVVAVVVEVVAAVGGVGVGVYYVVLE